MRPSVAVHTAAQRMHRAVPPRRVFSAGVPQPAFVGFYAHDVSLSADVATVATVDASTIRADGRVQPAPEARQPSDLATADDYGLVLFPWHIGIGVFAVVAECTDPATGAVCGSACFLIAIRAMPDERFSRLVARAARFLRGQ